MLDVTLLGCGGMMPMPHRYLTSLLARYNGMSVLIDCGEATQITLRKCGLSPKPIGVMCFTHYHADHISGLPGMLLTMGNAERTEPLIMIGPKGLAKVVNSLRCIAPELPFDIVFYEIEGPEHTFEIEGMFIDAFKVSHNVTCYGYSIRIPRQGRFDLEAAMKLPIDRRYWGKLQNGETVTVDGVTYTPDMVMGPDRVGIKLTYATDSRPTQSIIDHARGADLFICEGMYGEADKVEKAKEHKHMTFIEAAHMAAEAKPGRMWLTHFSPSLVKAEPYMAEVRKIFANAEAGKDGKRIDLLFED